MFATLGWMKGITSIAHRRDGFEVPLMFGLFPPSILKIHTVGLLPLPPGVRMQAFHMTEWPI